MIHIVFEPKHYLEVAKLLYATDLVAAKKQNISEAVHRASASRAYYAAFLSANQKSSVNSKGNNESHQILINSYMYSDDPKRVQIGNSLYKLKTYRTKSDYSMDKQMTKNDCGKSLELSEKILTLLEAIPSSAPTKPAPSRKP